MLCYRFIFGHFFCGLSSKNSLKKIFLHKYFSLDDDYKWKLTENDFNDNVHNIAQGKNNMMSYLGPLKISF